MISVLFINRSFLASGIKPVHEKEEEVTWMTIPVSGFIRGSGTSFRRALISDSYLRGNPPWRLLLRFYLWREETLTAIVPPFRVSLRTFSPAHRTSDDHPAGLSFRPSDFAPRQSGPASVKRIDSRGEERRLASVSCCLTERDTVKTIAVGKTGQYARAQVPTQVSQNS